MGKDIRICKNCGHSVGKTPRGLYVLRDDAKSNIRLYSTGFSWLHVVEYDGDKKRLGSARVLEYVKELDDLKAEFKKIKAQGEMSSEEESEFEYKLHFLTLESNHLVSYLEGPERDSRMFVLRCWGKGTTGRCGCQRPVPTEVK